MDPQVVAAAQYTITLEPAVFETRPTDHIKRQILGGLHRFEVGSI